MQTLAPIGSFEDRAHKLLGKAGFNDMLEFLARRPKAGRIIKGTGGLRKVRIARPAKARAAVLESFTTITTTKSRFFCC